MTEQTPRHFWLCADDYGIAPGVNAAIRDLVGRGRLNATSVMVVAPSCTQAEIDALKNAGKAAIGLHLTLTAPFKPLTAGFTPLAQGAFHPLPAMLRLALFRRLNRMALAREVDAQIMAFKQAFGCPPDFIDGHQHVHLFPQVRDAVLDGARRLARRRVGAPVRERHSFADADLNDPKGLLVDALSRAVRRRANKLGIKTNPAFAGTYTYRPKPISPTCFRASSKVCPKEASSCAIRGMWMEAKAPRSAHDRQRTRICVSCERSFSRNA